MIIINTILISKDKKLIRTTWRPIYQGENRCDEIQFLISPDFLDCIEDCTCLMQVVLPKIDESTGTPVTGRLRYMEIEEELYKGHYRMTIPITTVLTENTGEVELWFNFINEQTDKLIKTDTVSFTIFPSSSSTAVIDGDEENYDVLTQMQKRIDALERNKADKISYNIEDNSLQLYSGDDPIGEAIELSDDVLWANWDED